MAKKSIYDRGHKEFIEYVNFIVNCKQYEGMPDLYLDDGSIQWEAPSNRTGGKFKDTHHKRREWWRKKADELEITPDTPHWISQTAKLIHPTKFKPCKVCGKKMDIRYAYPSDILLKRIGSLKYFDESFILDPLEHITNLIPRLLKQFGNQIFRDLPKLLKCKDINIPNLPEILEKWLEWIEKSYMPLEPKTLSPGAMSNAPDRLDGFHSFNRCCRHKFDKGRSKENLQSYVTDRRVFEYWVDGDWVTADRLMGIIRSSTIIKEEICRNGHSGPCTADHIGPISLGFCHRPEFQLLCHSCNSGKNNRMYYSDIIHLRNIEECGNIVTSWYCQDLWNSLKCQVFNEETALRISKIFRDNRHTMLNLLNQFFSKNYLAFLSGFLGLEYADRSPKFHNLHVVNHITCFDKISFEERTTKYKNEQKARRIRVAFTSLMEYMIKDNRNSYIISSNSIDANIIHAIKLLDELPQKFKELDEELVELIVNQKARNEDKIRLIVDRLPNKQETKEYFSLPKKLLKDAMSEIASILTNMWEDERYVRARISDLS